MVPKSPKGTDSKKTRCHSTGARSPTETRPMKPPAMAATLLMPRASPRWCVGNASVTMAEELANSMAPPTPCPTRMAMSHQAPADPVEPGDREQDGEDGEDGEAEVEDSDPPEHVADPAQRDQQDGQDDHEAEQHPEQVARVARGQRVETDPAEDVGREISTMD